MSLIVCRYLCWQTNGQGTSDDVLHDTVGAVCVDDFGNIASAVSSGGIILKQPGRLGQVSLIKEDRISLKCPCVAPLLFLQFFVNILFHYRTF